MRRARSRWRINTVRSATFLAGATLDMGFARGAYLGATPASLTVTRASDGYAEDEVGNWSVFTSNVLRITNRGLLVEEARTNSIRNNSMQGAVAGSPGSTPTNYALGLGTTSGITRVISAVGVENGVEYIDVTFSGTASAGFTDVMYFDALFNVLAATTGQAVTNSVFLKLVSGSLASMGTFDLVLRENDSVPAFLRQTLTDIKSTPSTLTRTTQSVTLGVSTTGVAVGIRSTFTISVAVNFTIRIGWPQLELGAFATSPIRTTAGAVTRAADAVSLTGTAFSSWFTNSAAYTLYAEAVSNVNSTANPANAYFAALSDLTANNRTVLFRQLLTNSLDLRQVSGGVATNPSAIADATFSSFGVMKAAIAAAVGTGQAIGVLNGVLSGTAGTPAAMPVSLSRLSIGTTENPGGAQMNGYIRRIAYIPSRLSNAELQAITT